MEVETAQNQLGLRAEASDAELGGVYIVRDKDGNPKFDDPHNVPDVVLQDLTPSDLEYLNRLRNQ